MVFFFFFFLAVILGPAVGPLRQLGQKAGLRIRPGHHHQHPVLLPRHLHREPPDRDPGGPPGPGFLPHDLLRGGRDGRRPADRVGRPELQGHRAGAGDVRRRGAERDLAADVHELRVHGRGLRRELAQHRGPEPGRGPDPGAARFGRDGGFQDGAWLRGYKNGVGECEGRCCGSL
ncbi:unnamed protein product [Linum tenue]|uniref:Secreted protein n=1 Tax=Linum tenue TaxID=586396 RepID=A0AAV0JGT9_9ROSI|nr:unnamed protein product [Linum tenue]